MAPARSSKLLKDLPISCKTLLAPNIRRQKIFATSRKWLKELKCVKSIIVEGPSDMLLPPSTTHHSPLRKQEALPIHDGPAHVVQEKDKDKDKDKDMVDLPR